MRVQVINGVRTPLTVTETDVIFESIVSNFRLLTGEQTLEFDTAAQAKAAYESIEDFIPLLQQRVQGRWLLIKPGQLPMSSTGEIIDLSVPVEAPATKTLKPAAKVAQQAPAEEIETDLGLDLHEPVLLPTITRRRIKPTVQAMELEIGSSVLDLTGPEARVLADIVFALVDDSYADLDTEDSAVAVALFNTIDASEGTLETVLVRALDFALFGTEVELNSRQHQVAEEAAEALRAHVEG